MKKKIVTLSHNIQAGRQLFTPTMNQRKKLKKEKKDKN